jgi:SAM-dependent methyltransferase
VASTAERQSDTHVLDGGRRVPSVLNVGGNSKTIPLPDHYRGWDHLLLDIDPRGDVDLVCDARELRTQKPAQFDAVYCSHNLEHYYPHDVPRVLRGFVHVLKPDGFAEIRVPDLGWVMRAVVEKSMDIDDVLYVSPAGPILVRDVFYGWHVEIERSGQDFFAHKTGFTPKSLIAVLQAAGFPTGTVCPPLGVFEVRAVAFRQRPSDTQLRLLGLSGLITSGTASIR